MQTTAMLLVRSSSTPVLECLLARPAHHPELAPDAKIEYCSAGDSAHAPMSVSLSTPRASTHLPSTCQSHMHLDSPFRPSCSESPHSELPSLNGIRKVLSENDLSSLGAGGGSLMPAKIAANTLLQHPIVEDCSPCSGFDSHNSSPYRSLGKKGRALPPVLSRRRSLGSLPSELPSVFLSGDSTGWDFAILEEVELTPSCSSTGCETDEEGDADAGVFDKIALPVGRSGDMKKDVDVVIGSYGEVQLDGMPQKVIMQEMGNRQREASTGPPQADTAASSSGRWPEPVGTFEQSSSMYSVSWSGSASVGLALAEEVCEPSLPMRHVYHGEDNLEVGCNGGDGGRGVRPPITGGGGGGGDAGGLGRGGQDVADQHYQHVLQKDPGNPLLLRNYAQYLVEVKHDYRKAEEFFERAILASPTDGELLGQYAKMLWEVKHDIERAAMYFERAVQAAPDNSYVMAAYASFLWSSEEEEGQQSSGSGPSDIFGSFPSLVSAGLA